MYTHTQTLFAQRLLRQQGNPARELAFRVVLLSFFVLLARPLSPRLQRFKNVPSLMYVCLPFYAGSAYRGDGVPIDWMLR